MKSLFVLYFLVMVVVCVSGQNKVAKTDDLGRIVLSSHLDAEKSHIPQNAVSILKGKLDRISTLNGMGGSIIQRFIITANVNVLTQDITPTAPPMYAYTLEVTFYIGDGIDGTLFASTSVTTKGVGETNDEAFIAALKNVNVNDQAFVSLTSTGKNRILEYYNTKCDMVLAKAVSLADMQKYDESLFTLMSIPEVCKECYEKAMKTADVVYKAKIDTEGAKLLSEARAIWQVGQNVESAERAGEVLSQINPMAKCFADADKLSTQIAKRIQEIDDREWKYRLQEQANSHKENMATIEAYKEVAIAEVNVQSKTVEYYYSWW